jgi:hypothetical protein
VATVDGSVLGLVSYVDEPEEPESRASEASISPISEANYILAPVRLATLEDTLARLESSIGELRAVGEWTVEGSLEEKISLNFRQFLTNARALPVSGVKLRGVEVGPNGQNIHREDLLEEGEDNEGGNRENAECVSQCSVNGRCSDWPMG